MQIKGRANERRDRASDMFAHLGWKAHWIEVKTIVRVMEENEIKDAVERWKKA